MIKYVNPFEQLAFELSETIKEEVTKASKIQSPPTQLTQTETLRTCEEVLNFFHVSRPTLRRWEHDKKLIPIRVGRRMLFKQSDIDLLLKKGE